MESSCIWDTDLCKNGITCIEPLLYIAQSWHRWLVTRLLLVDCCFEFQEATSAGAMVENEAHPAGNSEVQQTETETQPAASISIQKSPEQSMCLGEANHTVKTPQVARSVRSHGCCVHSGSKKRMKLHRADDLKPHPISGVSWILHLTLSNKLNSLIAVQKEKHGSLALQQFAKLNNKNWIGWVKVIRHSLQIACYSQKRLLIAYWASACKPEDWHIIKSWLLLYRNTQSCWHADACWYNC